MKFYSSKQIGEMIGYKSCSLYWFRKRGMPYKKIGARVLYDLDEIKEWINEQDRLRRERETQ